MERQGELAGAQRVAVTPHRARAAAPVGEVLAGERAPAGARAVSDADRRIEVDAPAEPALPAIELGVLVVGEAFVVAAAAPEARHAKRGMMAMIDEAAAPSRAM